MNSGMEKTNQRMMNPKSKNRVWKFTVGDQVMVQTYNGGSKWIDGVIEQITGPVSYKVRIHGGTLRRHVDQLTPSSKETSASVEEMEEHVDGPAKEPFLPPHIPGVNTHMGDSGIQPTPIIQEVVPLVAESAPQVAQPSGEQIQRRPSVAQDEMPTQEVKVRRSGRLTKQPSWIKDYC